MNAAAPQPARIRRLPSRRRIIIGALGALTPILMNLLVADFNAMPTLTRFDLLGYAIRFVVLLLIGGMVGYFHADEVNTLKLFQLGIAGPALLTGYISAKSASPAATSAQVSLLVPTAYAQTAEQQAPEVPSSKETAIDEFWRGLSRAGTELASPDSKIGQARDLCRKLQQEIDLTSERPQGITKTREIIAGYRLDRDKAYEALFAALNSISEARENIAANVAELGLAIDQLLSSHTRIKQGEGAHEQNVGSLRNTLQRLKDKRTSDSVNLSDVVAAFAGIVREQVSEDRPRRVLRMLQEMQERRRDEDAMIEEAMRMLEKIAVDHSDRRENHRALETATKNAGDSRDRLVSDSNQLADAVGVADALRQTLVAIGNRLNEDLEKQVLKR